jgi:hypothetical protein
MGARHRVATVCTVLACALFALLRLSPSVREPRAGAFSARSALEVLRALGVETAHPVGTNAPVRKRIVERFYELGYTPVEQSGKSCSADAMCARVTNVFARLDGVEAGPAVLLTAHFDSVFGGPGVADDGAGVAVVLEVARILKQGGPLRLPVIFLLTDGEEAGLIGARVFAESPVMKDVGVVVNLEARGGSGPSLMFETSAGNGWLVDRMADGLPHPVTSSLLDFIYKSLPNDTDFSVYRELGVPGVNFAFISGPTRYHSTSDNLALLDPASLQDQGDHALAMVRSLASASTIPKPRTVSDHVFVDILGWSILHWPVGFTLPLALATAVAMAMLWQMFARERDVPLRSAALVLAGSIGVVVLASGLGWLMLRILVGLQRPFASWPPSTTGPLLVVFGIAGAAVAAGSRVMARARPAVAWAGVWGAYTLMALALAAALPVATYLVLPPAIGAALSGLAVGFTRRWQRGARLAPIAEGLALLLPAVLAAVLFPPLGVVLYDALGFWWLEALAAIGALALLGTLPVLTGLTTRRAWPTLLPLAASIVGVLAIVRSPSFDDRSPARVPIEHVEDKKEGAAQIVTMADTLPPVLEQAGFRRRSFRFSWAGPDRHLGPARRVEPLGLAAPELIVQPAVTITDEGATRIVNGTLRSNRGAARVAIVIPVERIGVVKVDSVRVRESGRPTKGLWTIESMTTPAEGVPIQLEIRGKEPLDTAVFDETSGLPESANGVLQHLPSWAVPAFEGHQTVIVGHQTL